MSVSVEFHFDFGSPNAYLSHLVLPALEERRQLSVRYVPVLLGGIFKATGNVSPAISLQGIRNKGEYQALEMRRFLHRHRIESFRRNPFFPVNTLRLMRGAIVAERNGYFFRYVDEMFRHMWSDPKKLDDLDVFERALIDSGLPANEILAAIEDPDVKARLISNTESSVARGVFGSPSFFVGEELFFGKDKLREVEEEIVSQQAALEG